MTKIFSKIIYRSPKTFYEEEKKIMWQEIEAEKTAK